MKKLLVFYVWLFAGLSPAAMAAGWPESSTKVVMLGTGTPVLEAGRAGSSIAVVVGGEAYLFDMGGGSVQNAIIAHQKMGIEELAPERIKYVFFTHLHSDHTLDYSVLAQTYWWRKEFKIQVFGPKEFVTIDKGMNMMAMPDIEFRMSSQQPVKRKDKDLADVQIIKEGIVYKSELIEVEAFLVPHGEFKTAYGYKVTTPDKTLVISGDTAFSEKLIQKAKGVDILLHEVINGDRLKKISQSWQDYHLSYHTTTSQLAEVAKQAKPGLLVLYHVLFLGESSEEVVKQVTRDYEGKVVLANDLDVFE